MWLFGNQNVESLRIKGNVKGLIKLLEDEDPEVRAGAADALSDFDKPEVISALINTLADKNREVRWRSAKSLERLCRDKTDVLIQAFIDSKSIFQKVTLAYILGRLGDKKAIAPLAEAQNFGDKYVRRASVIALGRIRDERSLYYLIQSLKDPDADVRKRAVESIGRIGILNDEVKKTLLDSLKDENYEVRKASAKTIERLGLKLEDNEELALYLSALMRGAELILLGDKAIDALEIALKDEDWNIKKWASEVISDIGGDKAIAILKKLAEDEDWTVRYHAVSALGRLKQIDLLIKHLDDPDPNVRDLAIEYIKDFVKVIERKDSKKAEKLKEILQKHNIQV
ncbi:HEAT repeat domain-containing protein [Archaeoglobus sulfaticallidus]|nr:HEAT repeat domain-containing protein [Archaeoglobus sulfaticallidus]